MQIIFIRHGEKPRGGERNNHLSHIGLLRAKYLPDYLLHPYEDFKRPSMAYVMVRCKRNRSDRCYETMLPTIKRADMDYELIPRHSTASLAMELKRLAANTTRDSGSIIVCWQHSRIVDFLNILGADTISAWGLEPEAERDDKDCFDATWVCELSRSRLAVKVFRQFSIDENDEPVYEHDRNRVWWQKEYPLLENVSKNSSVCTIV